MNNKTKLIIGVALILGIAGLNTVLVVAQANDYYAFMGGFTDIVPKAADQLDVTFQTYYIPLTGSATYTLTVTPITATINMSQPAQINNNIKAAINVGATTRGYNLKKTIMQSYNVANP